MKCILRFTVTFLTAAGVLGAAGAMAQERPAPKPASAVEAPPSPAKPPVRRDAARKEVPRKEAAPKPDVSRYCSNIQNAASEARFAVQRDAITRMEKDLEDRTKALEAKRAEYEVWYKRRMEVLGRADEAVLKIYSGMRSEAAAVQIAAMEDEVAAALLAKLKPRTASGILNEMEPGRAAQLANTITDAPSRAMKKADKK